MPDFEVVSWHMLFAPAATPKEIVLPAARGDERHHVRPRHAAEDQHHRPVAGQAAPLEASEKFLAAEREKWGTLVRKLGLEGTQ